MPQFPQAGPPRVLAVSTLVNSVGSGIYLTAGVLYFTQAARLPATEVGLGLGVAGLLALGAGFWGGHLADRHGPRGVCAAAGAVRAAATAGFVFSSSFWPFVLAVTLAAAGQAAGLAARGPIIRQHGGQRPQEFRAYLRSLTNGGIAVGTLLAGWAVQSGTIAGYRALIIGDAVAFAGAALLLLALPATRAEPTSGGPAWTALRDRPYLVLTLLDGVMSVQYKVLTVALPLWLVMATSAPRWLISAAMLVNTAIVILFQVKAGRGIDSPAAAGRAYLRAGTAFLASCALIPLSAGMAAWPAAALLMAAVVVHTTGELWQASASFEISFALAPEHATGQYLGVFGAGLGLAEAFGPSLLVALCITWGQPGWYVLGALFALTGLAAPCLVRRAPVPGSPDQPPAAHAGRSASAS